MFKEFKMRAGMAKEEFRRKLSLLARKLNIEKLNLTLKSEDCSIVKVLYQADMNFPIWTVSPYGLQTELSFQVGIIP
jgi:hypothetical protein